MGRAQLSADPDTVWLLALIEAMDEVFHPQACEPSDIKAFCNRLDLPAAPSPPMSFVPRIP
jgi:hypothetical protein